MPRKSSPNIGPMLPGFEMCDCAESITSHESIVSQEASPARISQMPERRQGSTESEADYGPSSTASFASYDHATSLWRTSQLCFTGEWAEYLGTWPRAGTMRNGKSYQRSPLVPHISGREFSLWPTVRAHMGGVQAPEAIAKGIRKFRLEAFAMLPTLTVIDAGTGRYNTSLGPNAKPRPSLAMMARKGLFPTLTSSPWKSGRASDETLARNSRPLNEIIAQGQANGQLNPEWAEWFMGFPIGWSDLEDSETL